MVYNEILYDDKFAELLNKEKEINPEFSKYVEEINKNFDSDSIVQSIASRMGFYIEPLPTISMYEVFNFTVKFFLENKDSKVKNLDRIIDMDEEQFNREYKYLLERGEAVKIQDDYSGDMSANYQDRLRLLGLNPKKLKRN